MARFIHLIRHGEPEAGSIGRYLGRLNPGLSPVGIRQAHHIAAHLTSLGPGRLLTSGLRRALTTAEHIGDACGLTPMVDERLLEIDFGELEGMTFAEAAARFAGAADSWQALSREFVFPGGEDYAAFVARTASMADEARNAPEERVVLVAHGGVLRGILCSLLGVAANGPLRFRFAYAALTTVENYGEDAVLLEFNARQCR